MAPPPPPPMDAAAARDRRVRYSASSGFVSGVERSLPATRAAPMSTERALPPLQVAELCSAWSPRWMLASSRRTGAVVCSTPAAKVASTSAWVTPPPSAVVERVAQFVVTAKVAHLAWACWRRCLLAGCQSRVDERVGGATITADGQAARRTIATPGARSLERARGRRRMLANNKGRADKRMHVAVAAVGSGADGDVRRVRRGGDFWVDKRAAPERSSSPSESAILVTSTLYYVVRVRRGLRSEKYASGGQTKATGV